LEKKANSYHRNKGKVADNTPSAPSSAQEGSVAQADLDEDDDDDDYEPMLDVPDDDTQEIHPNELVATAYLRHVAADALLNLREGGPVWARAGQGDLNLSPRDGAAEEALETDPPGGDPMAIDFILN